MQKKQLIKDFDEAKYFDNYDEKLKNEQVRQREMEKLKKDQQQEDELIPLDNYMLDILKQYQKDLAEPQKVKKFEVGQFENEDPILLQYELMKQNKLNQQKKKKGNKMEIMRIQYLVILIQMKWKMQKKRKKILNHYNQLIILKSNMKNLNQIFIKNMKKQLIQMQLKQKRQKENIKFILKAIIHQNQQYHLDISNWTKNQLIKQQDEADQMFCLDFQYQIRSIINQIRPDKQILLFTATMKKKIRQLCVDMLIDPIVIKIGENGNQVNDDIKQMPVIIELKNLFIKWKSIKICQLNGLM
ncbi:unnamed protein product [Paramecium pentaurelia]|uniref:Helicase ATP-binding domain-containing protein n=1 Tax=Paramecium pentaurelia TaxID=43138 RepID=A0A8S1XDL5_9CILI|nr:unnamed protein product [Paramecium pentaurelia]